MEKECNKLGGKVMTPMATETTNAVLKGPEGSDVIDLPITRFKFADGTPGVESCWEISKEEIEEVNKTGKVYFRCVGNTHPPIILSTYGS